jgi:hypothetical protein
MSVVIEARFVAPKLWFIHARVERSSVDAEGAAVERFELLRGIVTVSQRGWRLGARNIRVVVDGDGEVAGFFGVVRRNATPDLVA